MGLPSDQEEGAEEAFLGVEVEVVASQEQGEEAVAAYRVEVEAAAEGVHQTRAAEVVEEVEVEEFQARGPSWEAEAEVVVVEAARARMSATWDLVTEWEEVEAEVAVVAGIADQCPRPESPMEQLAVIQARSMLAPVSGAVEEEEEPSACSLAQ